MKYKWIRNLGIKICDWIRDILLSINFLSTPSSRKGVEYIMSEVIISRRGGGSGTGSKAGLKTVYITQNAQWEVPRNVKNNSFDVRIFGGGGGGFCGLQNQIWFSTSYNDRYRIGGGSSGIMNNDVFTNLTPGSIINITIGKGGDGGYVVNSSYGTKNPGTGGTTTFGEYLSANGGDGSKPYGYMGIIGGASGSPYIYADSWLYNSALQFGGGIGSCGGIYGGGGGEIFAAFWWINTTLYYGFNGGNSSYSYKGQCGGTYGGGAGRLPREFSTNYTYMNPKNYKGICLGHKNYTFESGSNGGMYGGGGGGHCYYYNYRNSYTDKEFNQKINTELSLYGLGGKGYGGNACFKCLRNINFTNMTFTLDNIRNSQNGTNTSTWTNVDNVGGVLLRGWGRHGSDTYGPGGGGGYGGNGGAGASMYHYMTKTNIPVIGGGGGGYGSNGGNGAFYYNFNATDNSSIVIMYSGGGGGYGGDGKCGGGGYGKQAIGGNPIYEKNIGQGTDSNIMGYLVGGAGGGGYFCPANGCAGGGIGIWSGSTMTASYGSGGNGHNGEDGVCIIQYYEE